MKRTEVMKDLKKEASRPTRGAWIETLIRTGSKKNILSRPTRGAWIETRKKYIKIVENPVAPHTGRVD